MTPFAWGFVTAFALLGVFGGVHYGYTNLRDYSILFRAFTTAACCVLNACLGLLLYALGAGIWLVVSR